MKEFIVHPNGDGFAVSLNGTSLAIQASGHVTPTGSVRAVTELWRQTRDGQGVLVYSDEGALTRDRDRQRLAEAMSKASQTEVPAAAMLAIAQAIKTAPKNSAEDTPENKTPVPPVSAEPRDTSGSGYPEIIITNRHLRDITADSIKALIHANSPPQFFRRGSELVRVHGAQQAAEPFTVSSMRGTLARVADFMKADGNNFLLPARPPQDVAQDILSLPVDEIPLPELRGIRTVPVFLPDGRVLAQDGYDPDTGLLLKLAGLDGLRDDMPVQEAKRWLLDELLHDFPFADEGSRAHTLALLLQPFVRDCIDGPTPLYLIDAPARGTGKGLLTDVSAHVTTGVAAATMSAVQDGDELEKRITSYLLAGHSHILLDNVTVLRSNHLAAVLTSTLWAGRRLGKSEIVHVPNHATWIATGNNVELSDELVRRITPIRLDAGVERPEERTGFKHPLPRWALENRRELVSACLSIINAWVKQGMQNSGATIGRFESWAGVMGGILEAAGVPGFLKNRERLHMAADQETREWAALCAAWYEAFGPHPITAGDLFGVAKERGLLLSLWGGRSNLAGQQRLGRALRERRDRIFGKWQIQDAGRDSRTGNAAYRLDFSGIQGQKQTPETPVTPPVPSQGQGVSGVSGVSNPPHTREKNENGTLPAADDREVFTI